MRLASIPSFDVFPHLVVFFGVTICRGFLREWSDCLEENSAGQCHLEEVFCDFIGHCWRAFFGTFTVWATIQWRAFFVISTTWFCWFCASFALR